MYNRSIMLSLHAIHWCYNCSLNCHDRDLKQIPWRVFKDPRLKSSPTISLAILNSCVWSVNMLQISIDSNHKKKTSFNFLVSDTLSSDDPWGGRAWSEQLWLHSGSYIQRSVAWKVFYSRLRHYMDALSVSLALCGENPPVLDEFPSQRARNAERWCFL